MSDFADTKVGDSLTRIFLWREKEIQYQAEVTAIDAQVITCLVYVDVPRTMRFSRKTGTNVMGREYGWLINPTAQVNT